ncbi:MAG: hypothetical protein H7144_11760 [Burkholderiales bacterium]|nr:hypothetical protein [Phycisphaerae bacterium]
MGWFARRIGQPSSPMVRPWAIAGPVLILILAAPLLRPLRAQSQASDREAINLAAVRAVLENGTLAMDPSAFRHNESAYLAHGKAFTVDSPAFPTVLAGFAWMIQKAGVEFDTNPLFLEYLLILFAITLPSALACGFLYRMGRIFEIRRGWRMLIALACVLATGWFSYCVVLLPYAPAAALVVMAAASIIHLVTAKKPALAVGWIVAGGFCAALAAAIEPTALWSLLLMPVLILAQPHPWRVRLSGVLLLIAGAAAPIALHMSINPPITGDFLPPRLHADFFDQSLMPVAMPVSISVSGDDVEPLDASSWVIIGRAINRLITLTIGSHGILSHFPVLLIALGGAVIILHRHWTRPIKWLAGGTILAMLGLILINTGTRTQVGELMFAAPGLLATLPILLLFSGAWLRRRHHKLVWVLAGIALSISVGITMIGATAPAPPGGYSGYTAAEAVARLLSPKRPLEPAPAQTRAAAIR